MILSLICLSALQTVNIADYFPTTPGLVRTYEQKGSGTVLTNKVGTPLDMGGVEVIPITESTGSAGDKTTYYRVDQDQVSIVAYDIKHPLVHPFPVLRIGKGELSWEYSGSTATGASGERLLAIVRSRSSGTRNVLGKKVDILTVKMSAAVGFGESGLTFDQRTVYAKGIGMIEQTTTQHLGHSKKAVEQNFSLVGFELPK